jgi:hypothetical protein
VGTAPQPLTEHITLHLVLALISPLAGVDSTTVLLLLQEEDIIITEEPLSTERTGLQEDLAFTRSTDVEVSTKQGHGIHRFMMERFNQMEDI